MWIDGRRGGGLGVWQMLEPLGGVVHVIARQARALYEIVLPQTVPSNDGLGLLSPRRGECETLGINQTTPAASLDRSGGQVR